MSRSNVSVIHRRLLIFIVLAVTLYWLVVASWNLNTVVQKEISCPPQQHQVQLQQQHSSSWSQQLPILPTVHTDNVVAAAAIAKVFHHTTATDLGGWIHVNHLGYDDIQTLRDVGQAIMSRNVSCGRPKVFGEVIVSGLEYCFWDNDFVSEQSLRDFSFERHLVGWVVQTFQGLDKTLQRYSFNASACQLGFLDVGVNVGDWASPFIAALPTTPFFGIEGTPSTSAIAAANMRTSVEHRFRLGGRAAPALLLPFSLIAKSMVSTVRESGGLCYGEDGGNIGGQGVDSVDAVKCKPSLVAGGTLLSHALQSIAPLQSCPGTQDWPRIYIAKFDIQRFEFKAMTSALDWLSERPPCYIMIETYKEPRTSAIIELLLDFGYDSVWRTHNAYPKDEASRHEEFPPGLPYWSRSRNTSISLHEAADIDLDTISVFWGNKDYLFGFEDEEKCLRRLLE